MRKRYLFQMRALIQLTKEVTRAYPEGNPDWQPAPGRNDTTPT